MADVARFKAFHTSRPARKVAPRWKPSTAWLPLVAMPLAVVLFGAAWTPWVLMWALALAIYAGLKWLSFADASKGGETSFWRSLAYLLLWPGMDAKSFFSASQAAEPPTAADWFLAFAKMTLGGFLVALAVATVGQLPLVAAWIGMVGIVIGLHFGLFDLLSLFWRRLGIAAVPIMNDPPLASSLSDFWGRRWNLAFRDLAHRYVFRPLVGRCGIAAATLAVFLVSGLVHDFVISFPAGGGYGLPTLYFALQAAGLLVERSRLGKQIGLGSGVTGWAFCAIVTLGAVLLLFHQPFVERVVIPMLTAIGSI